jgi:hypothetical protein
VAHDVIHTSRGDTLPPFDPVSFWTRFRHGTASVAGVRLHFVEGGEGAPILLLPGWPQSWYVWRYVMPLLAAAGRRVIALDPAAWATRIDRRPATTCGPSLPKSMASLRLWD